MNKIDASDLLAQMRAMSAQVQALETPAASEAPGNGFSALLKNAIDQVNENQQQAGALTKAFELGDASVDLAQVMVAVQKANVSFQAMTHVRNRLVSAYQDIMNMPV